MCPADHLRFRLRDRPQLERARSEAGEALSALRRLQRRVSELEEESRLQDADVSGASLQSELAHSLEDGDQGQSAEARGDTPVSSWALSSLTCAIERVAGSAFPPFPNRLHTTNPFLWPTDQPVPKDPRGIQSPAFTPGRELRAPQEANIPQPSGDTGEGGGSGQAAR